MNKAEYIKALVDGKLPFNYRPGNGDPNTKGPNGTTLILAKFVVPGSLRWTTDAGETMDLYRPHRDADDYQWFPRPGRGKWTSQILVCRPPRGGVPFLTDMVKNVVNAIEHFPDGVKAILGAACKAIQDHPDEVATAADIVAVSGGAPPGSGSQAVSTANALCNAMFPPHAPPPGPGPVAKSLPAGSITARDMKSGRWRVAIPLSAGLGSASAVTHLEIVSAATPPTGTRQVTLPDFQKKTGTTPFLKRPSTYIIGGGVLLGAGALGYALTRRRS